jgi:hypothetical protein
MIRDEYDVNKYSDSELYDILDLVNPSDSVLEAKIIQMINRYSSIHNESGEKLALFFKNIYDHFFYDPEIEDFQEGFESSTPQNTTTTQSQYILPDESQDISSNILISGNATIQNGVLTTTNSNTTSASITVNPVTYAKDKLNPLLKQTVQRIISIDSQYRDKKYPFSTNFTFNLSEPLRDVVSLRLYSIQIPYSWYTISKNYGGNFFYLKGNTEGINNGNFDYRIDISSGNYDPNSLINVINSSISNLKANNTDISFGSTSCIYNSYTNLASLNVDIKNNYNESNFTLYFDNDPNLNQYPLQLDASNQYQLRYNSNPVSSLSSYLGFNNHTYNANRIVSINTNLYKLGSQSDTSIFDNKTASFLIDDTNNTFTIVNYNGPTTYDPSKVLFSTQIKLSILGYRTRNEIITDLNTQLTNNIYLSNSYISRTDISGNENLQDYGLSYFSLYVNWNKKTMPYANLVNTKTAIIFPTETNTSNRLWTIDPNDKISSQNICFNFLDTVSETNNIIAETYTQQTNYLIKSNPYILLKCKSEKYKGYGYFEGQTVKYTDVSNISNYDDYSYVQPFVLGDTSSNILYGVFNDYLINLPNSNFNGNFNGYSLTEYLSKINEQMSLTNRYSIDNNNPNGVFNMTNMGVYNSKDTQNKILFRFDINKYFKNDSYFMDISDSYLYQSFDLGKDVGDKSGMDIDLSANNIFTSTIPAKSFYGVFTPLTTPYLAIIYPRSNYKSNYKSNFRADPFYIRPLTYNQGYNSYQFADMVQKSFQQYQDTSGSYPLASTTFNITVNTLTNTVTAILNIQVNKILSQNDYEVYFYDPSSVTINTNNPTEYDNTKNTWMSYFNLPDMSYNLVDYDVENKSYSDIYGTKSLFTNTYSIDKDTHIYIKPNTEGVISSTGANDYTITIPKATAATNFQYTLQDLYDIINTQFDANPYTAGSIISTINIKGNIYVQIRLNINRLFTAADYRLVFYDPYSFVKCVSGNKSISNVTWDSTLGWVLGFRNNTEYILSDYSTGSSNVLLIGDTTVSTNIYNYFLIVLDDYTQSHLNDGLVTLTPQENDITLPSYTKKSNFQCDPSGNLTFPGTLANIPGNNLTQNQIYAANQIMNAQKSKLKTYSSGPFIQDIFGLIPMKVSGLQNGASYIEFGGTLQNQERTYFGPVNIQRMTIKLITDRGDNVDLNGLNWSFSFICEQLYQQKSI